MSQPSPARDRIPSEGPDDLRDPRGTAAGVESPGAARTCPGVGSPPGAVPRGRAWTLYGLLLIAFVAAASAARWSLYPIFTDAYYHMAAIQGFGEAGGVPAWAFWEMAPGGRPHIYPPGLHALGCLAGYAGLAPDGFITLASWILYPACFLTTWIWMRAIAGPRAALATLILLCGPGAFFWNQTTFGANALTMTLAPLALLALERDRFLACAVLNFAATATHPMGLFLPAALAVNAILRRKEVLAGLLAAAVPAALYAPWLAHMWAHRAYLPPERAGGALALDGLRLSIGAATLVSALIGAALLPSRRREPLGLLGPIVGLAVVLPLGFLDRFAQYNVHRPLACLGGFGVAVLLEAFEERPRLRPYVGIASVAMAFFVLSVAVTIHVRIAPRAPPIGDARAAGAGAEGGGPGRTSPREKALRLTVRPSALARLLDPDSRPSMSVGLATAASEGDPGRRAPGPIRPGGAASRPIATDLIHQPGATGFLEAVRERVGPRQVVHILDPAAAALIAGVTCRWTSTGGLLDVSPARRFPKRADCEFAATPPGGFFGIPRDDGATIDRTARMGSEGFELVFENAFGSLWKNARRGPTVREPTRAVIPVLSVAVLVGLGLALIIRDVVGSRARRGAFLVVAAGSLAIAGVCLAPLVRTAALEILHPPAPPEPGASFPFRSRFASSRLPETLRLRHEAVRSAFLDRLAEGEEAWWLWGPDEEGLLQIRLAEGDTAGAEALLEGALSRLPGTR